MSLPKPKVVAQTPPTAPAAMGADQLKVGGDDGVTNRTKGAIGRLALRVGKQG